jgi:hypothetical protein
VVRRLLGIATCLAASVGCDAVLRLERVKDVPPGFAYVFRKSITIMQTTSANLKDFPVSVEIGSDADLISHAQADGSDLVFNDGTVELSAEIVAYTSGSLEAWVRVPLLRPGANTIYLAYGGDARTSNPFDTWSPDVYRAVWHASASGSERDSSSTGLDLGPATVPSSTIQGVAGRAQKFPGLAGQQLCSGDTAALAFDTLPFAYSSWVRITASSATAQVVLHKGGSSTNSPGFDFELGTDWHAGIGDTAGIHQSIQLSATPLLNDWHQIAAVVDRQSAFFRTYVDGNFGDKAGIATLGSVSSDVEVPCLAADTQGKYAFDGDLDEIRIYSIDVAKEWLTFEYDNLSDRGHVITVGDEETPVMP